jgi:hypothetical protein
MLLRCARNFATSSLSVEDSEPELWPETVETAKLLQELIDRQTLHSRHEEAQ